MSVIEEVASKTVEAYRALAARAPEAPALETAVYELQRRLATEEAERLRVAKERAERAEAERLAREAAEEAERVRLEREGREAREAAEKRQMLENAHLEPLATLNARMEEMRAMIARLDPAKVRAPRHACTRVPTRVPRPEACMHASDSRLACT